MGSARALVGQSGHTLEQLLIHLELAESPAATTPGAKTGRPEAAPIMLQAARDVFFQFCCCRACQKLGQRLQCANQSLQRVKQARSRRSHCQPASTVAALASKRA